MGKKQAVLIVVKPDGISKGLLPQIFTRLNEAGLELVAARVLQVPRVLAAEHYKHIRGKPFYETTIRHLLGVYYKNKKILAMVYCGAGAVRKCRGLAGATNPEGADPDSIRGAYGCVSSAGVFENVIHVSSDKKEAEREIKLWFSPEEISENLYKIKAKILKSTKKQVWA